MPLVIPSGAERISALVRWAEFTTRDDEALIAGLRAGDGPPVLLLHGGPGLGFDYLRDLAEELAEENDVAWYQQRGRPRQPSTARTRWMSSRGGIRT